MMEPLKISGVSQHIITKVIIHHSKTVDGPSLSWSAIRDWHTKHNGWDDVGYHGGIESVGNDLECFFGRPANRTGAHCRGKNRGSLGFCFVGDYDIVSPSELMLHVAAQRVLAPWLEQHRLTVDAITGDSDWHPSKTCPGKLFNLDQLRGIVSLYL